MGALVLASCGVGSFGDKRELADAIRDAVPITVDAGPFAGTQATTFTLEETRFPLQGVSVPFTSPAITFPMRLDPGTGRFANELPGDGEGDDEGGANAPFQVFDGGVYYQHLGSEGRGRQWLAYSLTRAYDRRDDLIGDGFATNFLNPVFQIQLLDGVLTGSVTEEGTETIGGVETTHLSANFDATQAFDDAPDEWREAALAAFELMSTSEEVIPGEVWIDSDGVVRQVATKLRQKLTRRDIIALDVTLTFDDVGADVTIELPEDSNVSKTSDLGLLARGLEGLISQITEQIAGDLGATFGGGGAGGAELDVEVPGAAVVGDGS